MNNLPSQPLKFSDGIEFDLSGPLRIEKRTDGFYVVGQGTLCPVETELEGRKLILRRQAFLDCGFAD
jgi:hypothetical protein